MKTLKRKLNNNGFGHVELLILIVVILALGGVGFWVFKHNKSHAGSDNYENVGAANFYIGKTPETVDVADCDIYMPTTDYGPVSEFQTSYELRPANSKASQYSVEVLSGPSQSGNVIPTVVSSTNSWWDGALGGATFYESDLHTEYIQYVLKHGSTIIKIGPVVSGNKAQACGEVI